MDQQEPAAPDNCSIFASPMVERTRFREGQDAVSCRGTETAACFDSCVAVLMWITLKSGEGASPTTDKQFVERLAITDARRHTRTNQRGSRP